MFPYPFRSGLFVVDRGWCIGCTAFVGHIILFHSLICIFQSLVLVLDLCIFIDIAVVGIIQLQRSVRNCVEVAKSTGSALREMVIEQYCDDESICSDIYHIRGGLTGVKVG